MSMPPRRRRPGPRRYTLRQPPPGYDDFDDRYCEPEITTGDVAELLGVTKATVRRWVARGYISPIDQLGPSNVFRTSEVLDAYEQIAARRKATGRPRQTTRWSVEPRLIDRISPKHHDAVVRIDEAAKLIAVSPATIRSWIHRGHLTPLASSTPRTVWLRAGDVIRAAHARRLPDVSPTAAHLLDRRT